MFERFTDRARRAMILAKEEAQGMGAMHVGTQHALIGLLREGEGVAARALTRLGVTLEAAREHAELTASRLTLGQPAPEPLLYSADLKKALGFALREALQLGMPYLGTEHLLLGLIREDCAAVRALVAMIPRPKKTVAITDVREAVMTLLVGYGDIPDTPHSAPSTHDQLVAALTPIVTQALIEHLGIYTARQKNEVAAYIDYHATAVAEAVVRAGWRPSAEDLR